MAAKMSPKFVVLSALAVGAIYATGYSISTGAPTALAAPNANSASNTAVASNSNASSGAEQSNTQSGQTASTSGNSSSDSTSNTNGTSSASGHTSGSNSSNGSSKANSTTSTNQTGSSSGAAQQYLDGTYSGNAANRIGAVGVSVTIKNGKIADVQITSCYTHYPESYINPVLPNYVVTHQTTQIPVVSGATLSTEDFYYAVTQALSKAQNPSYKG